MIGEIYIIKNKINGNAYIGQALLKVGKSRSIWGAKGRFRSHIREAFGSMDDHCLYLNNALRKYGVDNFSVEVLEQCKTIEEMNDVECNLIKKYNTLAPNGYNLQTGGTNTIHSKETCQKRSNSLKKMLENPEKREIWSKAKKGKIQKNKRKCTF